jgi:ElaB/YqjD/DUF883 family membrane-anchored ribosome-binding protein
MATSPRTQSAASTPKRAKSGRRGKAASRRRKAASRASATSRNANTTLNDFEKLQDDLLRLTRSVSALVSTRAEATRDLVTDTASEYYETGLDYARDAQTQVRGMAGDLSKQVERNPLAAVGIVFGVGYIIGLMRRR